MCSFCASVIFGIQKNSALTPQLPKMMIFICILILFIMTVVINCQNIVPVVQTNRGPVQGIVETVDGQQYLVYLGIPFAEPPVGPLRFQDPRPKKPWGPRILPANMTYSKRCVQPNTDSNENSEDCLYLNVFSPPQQENTQFPVMIWIHGGGFVTGSASELPVEGILRNLVSHGVIVVSINYRLGPFGFWTLKSPLATGNFGFMDQTMAIQWARDNIANFGGDPNKITLFGESAGGASVSIQTMSPMSQGLFQQAIMQSGSGLAVWAVKPDIVGDETDQLTNLLGCATFTQSDNNASSIGNDPSSAADTIYKQSSSPAVLQCMQSKSVNNIARAALQIKPLSEIQWAGRVDGKYLPETPRRLAARRPKINTIIGCTKDENGFFDMLPIIFGLGDPIMSEQDLSKSISSFLPEHQFRNAPTLQFLVKNRYIDAPRHQDPAFNQGSFWINQSVQLKSAAIFWTDAWNDAVLYANQYPGSVYLYSVDYLSPNVLKGKNWRGVVHVSDVFYLFYSGVQTVSGDRKKGQAGDSLLDIFGDLVGPIPEEHQDRKFAELLHTFWTNFAKFGNPTPQPVEDFVWQPFRQYSNNYCSLDAVPSMKQGFHSDSVTFWNAILWNSRLNFS